MAKVIACKLVHGLTILHGTERININGSNADYDKFNPPANAATTESENVIAGYGITQLTDAQAAVFDDWVKKATLDEDGKKLFDPFLPLTNGSIEEFSTINEARKALPSMTSMVQTGAEGLDADAEMKRATAGNPGLEVEQSVSK